MAVERTDEVPLAVRDALLAREPIFHRAGPDATRETFEAIAAPEFWEVGASGSVYDRQFVIDTLVDRASSHEPDPWEVSEFGVRHLGADVYLVTYRLVQNERRSRRSTIWSHQDDQWTAVYHQGTLESVPHPSPAETEGATSNQRG